MGDFSPVGSALRPHINPYWFVSEIGLHSPEAYRRYRDPALEAYLRGVAKRLVAGREIDLDAVEIALIDAGEVNAQLHQGRRISVTLGLLALMADEAELASVLAHELAHVIAQDGQETLVFRATGATREAAREEAGRQAAAYSKRQELAADRLGRALLEQAGYDPSAMASALGRIVDPADDRWTGASSLASHPFAIERLAALEAEPSGARHAERYLAAIDGMPYRPPRRLAMPMGDWLVSHDLGLAFPKLEGFEARIGEASLRLDDPKSRASLLFLSRPASTLGLRESLTEGLYPLLVRDLPLGELSDIREFQSFGGRAAVAGSIRLANALGAALDYELVVIDGGPRRFVANVVAAAQEGPEEGAEEGAEGRAEAAAPALWKRFEVGIRPLNPAERKRLDAMRLGFATVRAGQDVADFAKAFGGGAEGEALFRELNGLGPDEALTVGRRVKAVRRAR